MLSYWNIKKKNVFKFFSKLINIFGQELHFIIMIIIIILHFNFFREYEGNKWFILQKKFIICNFV